MGPNGPECGTLAHGTCIDARITSHHTSIDSFPSASPPFHDPRPPEEPETRCAPQRSHVRLLRLVVGCDLEVRRAHGLDTEHGRPSQVGHSMPLLRQIAYIIGFCMFLPLLHHACGMKRGLYAASHLSSLVHVAASGRTGSRSHCRTAGRAITRYSRCLLASLLSRYSWSWQSLQCV